MKIKNFTDNHYIIEHKKDLYFSSYDSIVAEIENNCILGKEKIFLGTAWDYSQTTLKNLYNFLEDFSTIRLENYNNNTLAYELSRQKNKKEFLQKLIDNKTIKIKKQF